jgi:hypothetical protein
MIRCNPLPQLRVRGRGKEAAGSGEGAQRCTFYSWFLPTYVLTITGQDAVQNNRGPQRYLSPSLDWVVAHVL